MKTYSPKGERDAKKRNFEVNRGLLLKLELRSNPNLLCVIRGAVERLTEVFGFSATRTPVGYSGG